MKAFALSGRFHKHLSETQGVALGYWLVAPVGAPLENTCETRPTANRQLPTANCQPPTANCQLLTANCQPPTANRQPLTEKLPEKSSQLLLIVDELTEVFEAGSIGRIGKP